MDSFDAEYDRIRAERDERTTAGVLSREDAAALLVTAAAALQAEALRLEECWWEDEEAAVFAAALEAIAAWKAAVAYRGDE